MKKYAVLLLIVAVTLAGCTPLERQAYNVAVGAKAFLDSEKASHPECSTGATSTLCVDIAKAVAAKDVLLDALTVYCSGPAFASGGACNPPAKGTPASTQAAAKLQAAISGYNQTAADIKAVTGGK